MSHRAFIALLFHASLFGASLFATAPTAGCSGTTSASSAADFAGTWSCPIDDAGDSLSFMVTASGNELTEFVSMPRTGLMCTEKFTVSGSTATLIPSLTSCSVPQGTDLGGTPSFLSQTVSGNVLTYTGEDEGGPLQTVTCVRQ